MKTICITVAPILVSIFLSGCVTSRQVESSAVTDALDLERTDRFAAKVVDSSGMDTAFDEDAQEYAGAALIERLEDEGFEYVGERDPDIRIYFRTYAATEPTYLDSSEPGEMRITTTETVHDDDGAITRTVETTETTSTSTTPERIYLEDDSRIFILDVFDDDTETLLWRGYSKVDDTSLSEEQLLEAIDELTDRLEEEAT